MRVIIAGSRTLTDPEAIVEAIVGSGFKITTIISGGARGVDQLGEAYAETHQLLCERYPISSADWKQYGKSAGPRRNARMAAGADGLIAIWDGVSPGTRNMIDLARRQGLQVYIHKV